MKSGHYSVLIRECPGLTIIVKNLKLFTQAMKKRDEVSRDSFSKKALALYLENLKLEREAPLMLYTGCLPMRRATQKNLGLLDSSNSCT